MAKEDYKYILWEFTLTFLLLLLVISLLKGILFGYWSYLVFCLPIGFISGWLTHSKENVTKLIVAAAMLLVSAWMVYSLFKSTFMYREVITIAVQGGLILEVILSFGAYFTPYLTYTQILSIPLFMTFPVFMKTYDENTIILILAYFIVWFVILKIKFYRSFKPAIRKSEHKYYSIGLLLIFFVVTLFISWIFFSHIPLGKITKGDIFFAAGGIGEDSADSSEKEYSKLQDEILNKIIRIIPKFESHDEQYAMLALVNSMVRDPPYVIEVEKAEQGLIDYLHRPGPGLKEGEGKELTILINNYLNKKTSINMRRTKEDIIDTLKKNRLNIKDRITASSHLNRMQQGNSFQQINKHGQGLRKVFDHASFDSDIKRKLKDSLNQFKEWKVFEIYQGKINVINERISSPEDRLGGEFQKILSGIRAAGSLEDIKKVAEYIEEIRGRAQPDNLEVIKNIKEIMELKTDMLICLKAKELKEKIEKSDLSKYELRKLADFLDGVKDAEDSKMLLENSLELKEKARESKSDILEEINNFLETKMYILSKTKKDKIEDMLKENVPDGLRKKFLEEVEKLLQEKNANKIVSDMQKIENDVKKFFNQGLISAASENNLIKELDGFGDFLLFELKLYTEARKEDIIKDNKQFTYQEELEEFIDNSSLGSEEKQVFKELTKKLFGAKTLLESENIKDEIEMEIESAPGEGIKKEEIEKFREKFKELAEISRKFIIDAVSLEAREKIEELKQTNPQEARMLEGHLREIRNSQNSKELKKNIEKLKEYVQNQKLQKSEESNALRDNLLRLYILPPRLIMSVGSSANLKVFAIYNNMFFKEINSDLEWSSSQPLTAWVDNAGVLHPKSQGKAVIEARYKGMITSDADVVVVNGIADEIGRAIKKEAAR